MTDNDSSTPCDRPDSIEITYTCLDGTRTRLRFEPATNRWALVKCRWDHAAGEWREVGTRPVRNVDLDLPADYGDQS